MIGRRRLTYVTGADVRVRVEARMAPLSLEPVRR
jgi:hypothetical protein